MSSDGSEVTKLIDDPAVDYAPTWSADGTKIALESRRDGGIYGEIYVMNAEGTEQTRLTNNPASDETPDWGPAADT
jgi:Tol biopolymer transport system component